MTQADRDFYEGLVRIAKSFVTLWEKRIKEPTTTVTHNYNVDSREEIKIAEHSIKERI